MDKYRPGGRCSPPKRGEIVVMDGVDEGGHSEMSKIAQIEDFGILKQTEVYDLD